MAAVDDEVRALQKRAEWQAQLGTPSQDRSVVPVQVKARPVEDDLAHKLSERDVMRQPPAEGDVGSRLIVRRQVDRKAFRNRSEREIAVLVEDFSEWLGRKRADQILKLHREAALRYVDV